MPTAVFPLLSRNCPLALLLLAAGCGSHRLTVTGKDAGVDGAFSGEAPATAVPGENHVLVAPGRDNSGAFCAAARGSAVGVALSDRGKLMLASSSDPGLSHRSFIFGPPIATAASACALAATTDSFALAVQGLSQVDAGAGAGNLAVFLLDPAGASLPPPVASFTADPGAFDLASTGTEVYLARAWQSGAGQAREVWYDHIQQQAPNSAALNSQAIDTCARTTLPRVVAEADGAAVFYACTRDSTVDLVLARIDTATGTVTTAVVAQRSFDSTSGLEPPIQLAVVASDGGWMVAWGGDPAQSADADLRVLQVNADAPEAPVALSPPGMTYPTGLAHADSGYLLAGVTVMHGEDAPPPWAGISALAPDGSWSAVWDIPIHNAFVAGRRPATLVFQDLVPTSQVPFVFTAPVTADLAATAPFATDPEPVMGPVRALPLALACTDATCGLWGTEGRYRASRYLAWQIVEGVAPSVGETTSDVVVASSVLGFGLADPQTNRARSGLGDLQWAGGAFGVVTPGGDAVITSLLPEGDLWSRPGTLGANLAWMFGEATGGASPAYRVFATDSSEMLVSSDLAQTVSSGGRLLRSLVRCGTRYLALDDVGGKPSGILIRDPGGATMFTSGPQLGNAAQAGMWLAGCAGDAAVIASQPGGGALDLLKLPLDGSPATTWTFGTTGPPDGGILWSLPLQVHASSGIGDALAIFWSPAAPANVGLAMVPATGAPVSMSLPLPPDVAGVEQMVAPVQSGQDAVRLAWTDAATGDLFLSTWSLTGR